jgi:hypothetical protein
VDALQLVQHVAGYLGASGVPAGRDVSIHPLFTSLGTVHKAIDVDHVPLCSERRVVTSSRRPVDREVSAGMPSAVAVRAREPESPGGFRVDQPLF